MAAKKKKTIAKVKTRRATKRVVSHSGYHKEHIAMLYRLGGAGIVIVAGTIIIFLVKTVFFL